MNKLKDLIKYINKRYPELIIEEDKIGMIETDKWMLLAVDTKNHSEQLLFADFSITPRKIMILPLTDTVAFFCARHIVARRKFALISAQQRARELEKDEK